jgi:hypothetical protein
MPIIRQLAALEWTLCVFDFKFPDLGQVTYYHYLLGKQQGKLKGFKFHVVNLTEPEKSRRINPWRSDYLQTLAEASETAEALVEAMKKGDKASGSDQFFTQSAVNFLAACIYFFSKHEDGRYSSFPHVLAFLNRSYEEIFTVLFSNRELESLLSPFMTAFKARAFDQLEGQVGTLKIFISRLATKETFWVFSGDDFDLKISNPDAPSMLILASNPNTQSTNSASYSVVINRITKLINTRGNIPVGLVVDEAPTLYLYKVQDIISQARSNRVSAILGVQGLTMFRQQYGKETADTIISIVGNILSGSIRDKDGLEWMERLFGKVKQMGESLSIDRSKTSVSLNEKLEPLIPAGKIASLRAGEMVGLLASDAVDRYTGQFETTAVNCRIDLDLQAIHKEEEAYPELPVFYDFGNHKDEILLQNFYRISEEVGQVVEKFKPSAPPRPSFQGKAVNPKRYGKMILISKLKRTSMNVRWIVSVVIILISIGSVLAQQRPLKQISLYAAIDTVAASASISAPLMPTNKDEVEAAPLEPEVFMPLAGYKISSAFGWRKHPLTGKQHFHNGVDLPARSQVVHAIMSGRVQSTGYHKSLGKFIRIDHGFICSIYGHLSRIAVKNGQVLPAGFPIAITGSTGRSTGEHLHLSIRSKDTYIDPWKFLQGLLTNSTTNIN